MIPQTDQEKILYLITLTVLFGDEKKDDEKSSKISQKVEHNKYFKNTSKKNIKIFKALK